LTVKEFIEELSKLPQDATIGISEYLFLNNTGYDEIKILPNKDIEILLGNKDLDFYMVGKHVEWMKDEEM